MLEKINQILKRNAAVTVGAALVAVWSLGAPAKAVLITPGNTLNTTGEATPAFGAPLYTSENEPFDAINIFTLEEAYGGDLDSEVYADPTTGNLDFVYQFSNTFAGGDSILHFSVSGFPGWTTDADYLTGTGTNADDAPAQVTRNSDDGGSTLDFAFPSGVAVGEDSAEVIVKTNAPVSYFDEDGSASFQDGSSVTIVAPATVPEPATAAIAAFGVCAPGLRRRNAAPKSV